MSDLTTRVKLNVDVSEAQNNMRLIDQQYRELGKGADTGAMADGLQELIDSQKQFFGSFNSFITTMTSSTTKLASQMEATSKAVEKALKRDADKVYQDKLKELEAQKKMLEAQLNSQRGGGGTPPPSSGGSSAEAAGSPSGAGGSPSSPLNNPSNPNSVLGRLRSLTANVTKMTVALAAIRAATNYVGTGAARDRSIKQQGYETFARTGYYGTDYSGSRTKAFETGSTYGYGASETMTIQGNLMSRTGYTGMSDLTQDTRSLMQVSKAYGMDTNQVVNAAGRFVQTGTVQSGEQAKFANLLATSIVEAGMTGRESEQLEVLQSINDNLGRNMVDVTNSGMTNALGLYNMLANQNSSLKGERGASVVSTINDSITNGGADMDYLLGWGTTYRGVSGRWQLEEAKARGISDPENLKEVVKNFEGLYGQSIDSDAGKLMLMNVFGLKPEQVNELVSNPDALRNGTYGEAVSAALDEGVGTEDIDNKIQDYLNSDVAKEEQFDLNTENAQDSAGSLWNKFIDPAKNWFNNLSTGWQTALGLGGAVGTAAGGAYGISKIGGGLLGKLGEFIGGGTSGTAGATGAAGGVSAGTTGAANGIDDAAGGVLHALDGVDDALRNAANGLDDAAAAGLDDAVKGLDDAMAGFDDAVRGAAGGLDDAVGGASKALSGLSKFAKGAAIVGAVMEGVSTAVDVNENIQSGDNRNAASEAGGGVGSIAGGAAGGAGGAWAGGAIGALLAPFTGGLSIPIGAFIGGLGGGVGGSMLGNAAGEAAGEGIYDLTTGGDQYNWTDEQISQVQKMYWECSRLYNQKSGPFGMFSHDNNAAQNYTKNTIAPYLESIGVSKSITKKYDVDTGYPDFMKDCENGTFPVLSSAGSVGRGGGFGRPDGSVGGGGFSGSHATGNDYIPYDGYIAETHKGEAILTAHEAKQWREGKSPTDLGSQSNAFQRITDTNADIISQYARLIEDESDVVDRRERLIEQQNGLGSTKTDENGVVSSNNLTESKESTLLDTLSALFGINLGRSTTSGGGIFSRIFGANSVVGNAANTLGTAISNALGVNTSSNNSQTPTGNNLAEWVSSMISQYEGGYGSINYNDNGAVSIGRIQWHAGNAKNLLNQIKDADPNSFNSIIQQTGATGLAQSLASDDNWSSHIVSKGSTEAQAIKAILESSAGQMVQDQQRVAFVNNYIEKGKKLGLTDPKALAFYSDMCNQYGMYNDTINTKVVPQAVANGGTLDALYQAAIANLSKYHERRTNVYNQLNGSDLSAFQDKATGVDRVPYDGYLIRAHKDEALLTRDEATDYREKIGTLDALYQAAIANLSKYHERRTNVYNQLNGSDLSAFQDKATGVDRVPYDGYLIRAHKDEALLTRDEATDYREKIGTLDALNSYNTPQDLSAIMMGSQQGSSDSQPFSGELKITIGGNIQGMTPDNQNMIVQAVLQQIRAQGQGSVLQSLNNALTRLPH
ncbi:MAG: hypothetical protein NC548_20020 [Lachnospiraceae bacterium]|nr:hypothetical protein [Lachnospiraceae bacterium]